MATYSSIDDLVEKVGLMLEGKLETDKTAYYTKNILKEWLALKAIEFGRRVPEAQSTGALNDRDKHLKTVDFAATEGKPELPDISEYFANLTEKKVVVVGAGPSLDKNIAKLRKVDKKTHYIACANGALNALDRMGISVDFVFCIDRAPQLQVCFDCCETTDYMLFVHPAAAANVINSFRGEKYYNKRSSRGTVTGAIVKTFKDFGFKDFVFVGCDFEIAKKGKSHCRYYPLGQGSEMTKFQVPAREFEKECEGLNVINCTEGGILNITKRKLSNYIRGKTK